MSDARFDLLPKNPDKTAKGRFPSWLHRRLPTGNTLKQTGELLGKAKLNTVCEEAKCPNLFECWSKKTATFLVMGKECTRNCGFCAIDFSKTPAPLEEDEPSRVAASVAALGLKHVVITMVARDDLPDGGAAHLAKVIDAVRLTSPSSTIEVLTSDFSGNQIAWNLIADKKPDIFNHNIETVKELSPRVRHKATYERTLSLLSYMKKMDLRVKSGLMVGLGETETQVHATLNDLKHAGCDIVTIGQYLQADKRKLRVKAFIEPAQFESYRIFGENLGMRVFSGPFVRSSYNAELFVH